MKKAVALIALTITVSLQAQVSVCLGETVSLVASNPSGLSNPSYSLNPGGITSSNPNFILTPTINTGYTICTKGTDMSNNVVTTCTQSNVIVKGLPSFNLVSSPPGYTLGCGTKSAIVVNFVNGASAPPGGGPISYTLLYPGGAASPQVTLSPNFSYTLSQPGTYTAITRDNNNFCDAKLPFTVVSNTFLPSIDSITVPVLNCANTVVTLQAFASAGNVNYKWTFPPQNLSQAGNTISVFADLNAPVTLTVAGVYTVTVQDNSSLCENKQTVIVKRNFFPPKAQIMSATASITCTQPTVMLTNASSTGIPPGLFPSTGPVSVSAWYGPGIGPPPPASTYVAAYAGTYTLLVIDQNNGCSAMTTTTLMDGRIFTTIDHPDLVDLCGQPSTTIIPVYTGNTTGAGYLWATPQGAVTGPVNGPDLVTNSTGFFTVTITNSYGCKTTEVFEVVYCVGINENDKTAFISVYPNPGHGLYRLSAKAVAGLTIQVYDAALALVKEIKIDKEGVLDITDHPCGIYFLRIPGRDLTLKLLKN